MSYNTIVRYDLWDSIKKVRSNQALLNLTSALLHEMGPIPDAVKEAKSMRLSHRF